MRNKLCGVVVVLGLMLGIAIGCNSSTSSSGGNSGTSWVDLAVGDRSYNNNIFQVFLWFNVLANDGPSLPAPDVTLDAGDHSVVNVYFYNGDLYAASTDQSSADGGILIWRDYLNTSDGDTPDVTLFHATDATLGPEAIQRIALEGNVMVGSTWYGPNDGLFFWDNASDLADGAAPDLFMDDTSLPLATAFLDNNAQDVVLLNGRLFVATSNSGTSISLGIWNDVQDILSGGADTDPDETLTEDTNLFDLGSGLRALDVDANGALYATSYYGYSIFKFNDASTMDSSTLPDVVINGCGDGITDDVCDIDTPNDVKIVNNTLFIANNNQNFDTGMNAGVVGFANASDLTMNQIPNIHLTRDVAIGSADRLATAGGALFVSGVELDDNAYDYRAVHIYKNAANIFNGVPADLSVLGDQDTDISYLEYPTGVAATVRGTIDN